MGVHQTDRYAQIKGILGIPEDEPIFIIRGQDKLAVDAIDGYIDIADDTERVGFQPGKPWYLNLENHVTEFKAFAKANPDRMKYPD